MTDDHQRARELLAMCLDDWGCPTEASNVRASEDLESYECEFRLLQQLRVWGLLQYPQEGAALRAAPEGPNTHYHCEDGIRGTVRRLRRYSTTASNRGTLQGQTMEEAAAFIEHILAARPQGVKDRPPIDGCTESNCKRCRTHPNHRGDMEHAGIGWRPDSPQEASE